MAPMFSGNTVITGGTFTHVEYHGQIPEAFKTLYKHIASGAFHNSNARFDPPKCHPGTREAVLTMIIDWVERPNSYPIIWLHGPAGAGKSAIAQMIAELCFDLQYLLASFFFSRSASVRNNGRKFIITIAYQMSLAIPSLRRHIEEVIEQDLAIFTRSLEAQVQRLIIYPLQQAKISDPGAFSSTKPPHLILVDGLDECGDEEDQSRILDLLCGIAKHRDVHPFIVFVASRPERHIHAMFDYGDLNRLTTRISLDGMFNPDKDIRLFLDAQFDEIKEQHPFRRLIKNPTSWPSEHIVDILVEKSSGQFIFPSMVCKYLQSRRHRPDERLKIICGVSHSSGERPYAALDALYTHIFDSALDVDLALRIIVLKLTGDGVVLFYPYKVNPYADNYKQVYLERIERFLSLDEGSVEYAFAELESIIAVGAPSNPVGFFHASLSDFLLDRSRSRKYHIDIAAAHADFAVCHIKRLEAELLHFSTQQFIDAWEGLVQHLPHASPTAEFRQWVTSLKSLLPVLDQYVNRESGDGSYSYRAAKNMSTLLDSISNCNLADNQSLAEELKREFERYQEVRSLHGIT